MKRLRELLESQGVRILLPEKGSSVSGDVIVEPLDDNELKALEASVEARIRIRERDPWRALLTALFAPRRPTLRAGIDPGLSCAIAVFGDNLLIWAERLSCEEAVDRLLWVKSKAGAPLVRVNLGSGEGYEIVARRLIEEGVPFTLAPEAGTSRRERLLYALKDRDVMAAIRLALSGAGGGI